MVKQVNRDKHSVYTTFYRISPPWYYLKQCQRANPITKDEKRMHHWHATWHLGISSLHHKTTVDFINALEPCDVPSLKRFLLVIELGLIVLFPYNSHYILKNLVADNSRIQWKILASQDDTSIRGGI